MQSVSQCKLRTVDTNDGQHEAMHPNNGPLLCGMHLGCWGDNAGWAPANYLHFLLYVAVNLKLT